MNDSSSATPSTSPARDERRQQLRAALRPDADARDLALAGAAVVWPLALAGGVILGDSAYRRRVVEALRATGFNPAPVALVPEPAQGALRLAASLC
ncbi:MAG: hypothetical protein L0Z62_19645 [Gemmataceae bacterium]|nr:hypothetical protein [Gemmataceae bacterium]